MHYIHTFITQIGNIPPEIWQMALVGILASTKLQIIKKFIKLHDWEVKLGLGIIYLAGSFLVYALNTEPLLKNQLAAILSQVGIAGITASPFYLIFVKGLWGNVLSGYWGQGKQLQNDLKSSLVPAEGLQLEAQGAVQPATIADPTSNTDFGA